MRTRLKDSSPQGSHFSRWRSRWRHPDEDLAPKTVFVLSGGGLNGAAQVGMLEVLFANGIYPDAVVGVSAGALNGIYLASNPTPEGLAALSSSWDWVSEHGIFEAGSPKRLWAVLRQRTSLDDGSLLRSGIEANLPVQDLSDCQIPLRIGTVELISGTMCWWSTGPALELLMASAAIPGVFPPVNINGTLHVDGGVCSPVPVAAAVDFHPTRIVILDVSMISGDAVHTARRPPSALEVLLRSFDAARHRVVDAEFAALTPDVEVIHIRGGLPVGVLPDSTDSIPEITESGREAARKVLESMNAPDPVHDTESQHAHYSA